MIPKSMILVMTEIKKLSIGEREFFPYGALTFAFATARAWNIGAK